MKTTMSAKQIKRLLKESIVNAENFGLKERDEVMKIYEKTDLDKLTKDYIYDERQMMAAFYYLRTAIKSIIAEI